MVSSSSPVWELVSRLQQRAEAAHFADPVARDAHEDALSRLVDDIAAGELVNVDAAEVERRFRNHRHEACKRRRRRDRLLKTKAMSAVDRRAGRASGPLTSAHTGADDALAAVEEGDAVVRVRDTVTIDEWSLLDELARGATYEVAAARRRMKTGTLKAVVSRVRARVRVRFVAAA